MTAAVCHFRIWSVRHGMVWVTLTGRCVWYGGCGYGNRYWSGCESQVDIKCACIYLGLRFFAFGYCSNPITECKKRIVAASRNTARRFVCLSVIVLGAVGS